MFGEVSQAGEKQLNGAGKQIPLSRIFDDLNLPHYALGELQQIGISTVADFFGLINAAFEEVAQDLHIPPARLREVSRELRNYIDSSTLQKMDKAQDTIRSQPFGAELGKAPKIGKVLDYDEE
ncbi:MAG TPA: hypothetical protein VGB02_16895 [Pyrinomonadaceae bacterium]|jgi:hypothetical protein